MGVSFDDTTPVDRDALGKPFPAEALKTRPGGGNKKLTYVEGHSVINRLNNATGNRWIFTVDRFEVNGDLLMAFVTLTLPGMGSRSHVGVQKFAPNSGEDLAKGCITDGLKKAATLFGVGIELYGEDYEDYEDHAAPRVSEKTMARLHALGARKGYDHAKIHAAAVQAFGVEHTDEITEEEAAKLIGVLEKKPDAEAAPKAKPAPKGNGKAAPLHDAREGAGVAAECAECGVGIDAAQVEATRDMGRPVCPKCAFDLEITGAGR
jgi:hypothetical protein